jgi:hypothetical protein
VLIKIILNYFQLISLLRELRGVPWPANFVELLSIEDQAASAGSQSPSLSPLACACTCTASRAYACAPRGWLAAQERRRTGRQSRIGTDARDLATSAPRLGLFCTGDVSASGRDRTGSFAGGGRLDVAAIPCELSPDVFFIPTFLMVRTTHSHSHTRAHARTCKYCMYLTATAARLSPRLASNPMCFLAGIVRGRYLAAHALVCQREFVATASLSSRARRCSRFPETSGNAERNLPDRIGRRP